MARGNILSGGAFFSALLSLGGFMAVLLVLGILLYYSVGHAMEQDLEDQLVEESLLFQQIYNESGREALMEAVRKVETPAVAANRLVGLYSEKGYRLAGNLDIGPSYVGWLAKGSPLHLALPRGEFWLYARNMAPEASVTVVVGREANHIEKVKHRLLVGLVIAGLVVTITSVGIGYIVSNHVFGKLERVSAVLEETSRGNMEIRIPIGTSNDQIDRISRRINQHLDRLSLLAETTRGTINTIAHDLRSPLNRMFILVQEAAAGTEDVRLKHSLDDMAIELSSIIGIFDAILRISRIEMSSGNAGFTICSAAALIDEMEATFGPVIEESGQTLVSSVDRTRALELYGDVPMLHQMMANLIQNANHHCPAGTTITIGAEVDAEGHTILQVADNGPGILAIYHVDVVKPFYRLDSSRTTAGTGLGLALVNAIAVRHGATLKLSDNRPGLSVEVTFPAPADNAVNFAKN